MPLVGGLLDSRGCQGPSPRLPRMAWWWCLPDIPLVGLLPQLLLKVVARLPVVSL